MQHKHRHVSNVYNSSSSLPLCDRQTEVRHFRPECDFSMFLVSFFSNQCGRAVKKTQSAGKNTVFDQANLSDPGNNKWAHTAPTVIHWSDTQCILAPVGKNWITIIHTVQRTGLTPSLFISVFGIDHPACIFNVHFSHGKIKAELVPLQ